MCPSPSFTYTLTNGTTADADQVMQNFNDLLNGVTDGTKDLSVSALTAAGTATFNGAVNLGNASADDLTFTGSLASTIPIKTTNTYNIGSSTLGLAGVYFGANSQTVRLLGSASMSATWSMTLPVTAGTNGYRLVTNGSGVTSWDKETLGTLTNDSAAAGYVGEFIEAGTANSSAVSLSTGTGSTVGTLALTAGDWDVGGIVGIDAATTTSLTVRAGSISLTTNTLSATTTIANPVSGETRVQLSTVAITNQTVTTLSIPPVRVSLSGSTTYYLVAQANFTVSTATGYGRIWARRVR